MKPRLRHPPEFTGPICALYGDMSAALIGQQFGKTRNAVIGIWHRHMTPEQRAAKNGQSKTVMERIAPTTMPKRPAGVAPIPPLPIPPIPSSPEPEMVSDCWSATTRSLMDRPSDGCAFLSDDPPHGVYCCEPVVPGQSMCVQHFALCRIPTQGKPRPYVQQSITGRAA